MNKIIIAIVAIVIIAGGAFVITKKDDNNKSDQNPTVSNQTENSSTDTDNAGSADIKNPLDPDNYTSGANIGSSLDATNKTEVNVSIDDSVFQTTYLKVKKGTKVTWTNEGQIGHNVVSDDSSPQKGLASDLLSHGQSYSFTFTETGTYDYLCTIHPTQMKAVVIVVD